MKENLGLRVLALVIAIVLWAYVRVTNSPAGREVLAQITLTLPLERQGNAPNLIPYEYSAETVDVTLEGESRVVKQLREGLVRAYVDLNGMTAGSHWPEVKVLYPPEVRLVDQEPRSVNVKISPLLAKEVPVEVKVGGNPAEGMSTGDVSVDPDRVKIQGPEALVNEVARVRGRILLDGQSRTFTADVTGLVPVSENGTPVAGNNYQVRVAPKRVAATVPIESKGTLMGVPVALENARVAIREGYRYSMRADPSVVTIRVAQGLSPPTVIKTEAVDFGAPTSVIEQEVALLPPKGVTLVSATRVRVRVTPEKKEVPSEVGTEASPSAGG